MSTVTLVMAGHEFIVSGAGLRFEVVELAGKRVIGRPEFPSDEAIVSEVSKAGDRNPANSENDDVDRSALRAGHAGQITENALAGQVESRSNDIDPSETASLAAREGEEAAAPQSESEPPAPPAGDCEAGGELLPAPGHPLIGSADSAVSDGEPGTPTEDEVRADPGRDADRNRESSGAVTNLKPRKPLRPHCQRPTLCGGYGDKHCGTCLKQAGIAA